MSISLKLLRFVHYNSFPIGFLPPNYAIIHCLFGDKVLAIIVDVEEDITFEKLGGVQLYQQPIQRRQ